MSSKYSFSAYLNELAESAEFIIRKKYSLGKPVIDAEISKDIGWRPTMHWKTKEGYIACEVSERPHPPILTSAYAEIYAKGLPIKIISAFPIEHSLSHKDYQADKNKAKEFGMGILPVNSGKVGSFEHYGIQVSLHLPCPVMKSFHKSVHGDINHAYDIYSNSDPAHGVQELGQIVEKVLINLADDAKKKGKLAKSGFKDKDTFYALNTLISDLIDDKVIDKIILKKCGTFADDRNSVSHKTQNLAEAIKKQSRIKDLFKTGLFILEDLPEKMKQEKYTFKY